MTERLGIAASIRDRSAAGPDQIAIRDGGTNISYGRFAATVERVALALAGEGIGPSSRVGIEASNLYAHWVAMMAVMRLGAEAASLTGAGGVAQARIGAFDAVLSTNTGSPLKEASPKFIFYDDDWMNRMAAAAAERGAVLPEPATADRTLGCIVFSSGATGEPKGVLQGGPMLAAKALEHARRTDKSTKFFCSYGMGTTPAREIGTWHRGGTVVFPYGPRSQGPEAANSLAMSNYVVTSPGSLVSFLASRSGEFEGREERIVRIGGAPLPVELRDDALKRLSARVEVIYGSSELGTMAEGDAMVLDRRPGAVGYAVDGIEIEIAGEDGSPLPPGTEGRIRGRAPYMATGYIGDTESAAVHFRDGWFYPGDIGRMEEDGLIVLLGRDNEVTNVGGAKFSPEALEHRLRQIPGIEDVCALAVPNRSGVKVLVILGVSEATAKQEALEAEIGRVLLAAELSSAIIRWTDEIPRGGRDKPLRQRLVQEMRERLWG